MAALRQYVHVMPPRSAQHPRGSRAFSITRALSASRHPQQSHTHRQAYRQVQRAHCRRIYESLW
eukprot:GDKH01028105.1.p1 GENE.GDKH01028105.1~~GDKH01028105.1.p1  ORF type:complete len:64 (-),score=6.27 GDKH01028105.1:14-205(-)